MKTLSIAFILVAVIYGLISIVQAAKILASFSIGLSSTGIGLSFSQPPLIWLRIALFLGSLLQLASAAYVGRVGIRLLSYQTKGIRLASTIAIFLFPVGTVAGIFGFIVNSRSLESQKSATN